MSSDNVKVRFQATRHVRATTSVTCQVDRNAAVILAPPRVIPIAFDSAHEALSRVHYSEDCALFDAMDGTLRQFQVGINTALCFMGHTSFRQKPHDVLDGLLAKVFKQVVNGAKGNSLHHQVQLRAQFAACVPPRRKYLDLLRDDPAPNPQPSEQVDPAVGDGWCAYTPINTFDPIFSGTVTPVNTPEDALNLYVMGLHRLHRYCTSDRTRNSDTAVEDTATVFVLECRQEPKRADEVILHTKLFLVDLPGYVSHGAGGELQKFLLLLGNVAECQASGRQPASTLPRGRVDPLDEVLLGEGVIGGNCATELVVFYEDRAGVDETTAIRLLQRASEARSIRATPIINDEALLLYTTRMRNSLEGMRALCSEHGGVPLAEFDKACAKVEVREERLKGQVALYAERCTNLQAELVASEREKQELVGALDELRQREMTMQAANLYSNQDIASRLNDFEKDLLRAKMEAQQQTANAVPKRSTGVQAAIATPPSSADGERGGGKKALAKLEQDKHAIEKEFVALRVNYFHLVDEHKRVKQDNESLVNEVATLRGKSSEDVSGQVKELKEMLEKQAKRAPTILPPLTPPKEDREPPRRQSKQDGGGDGKALQEFMNGPHQLVLEERDQLRAQVGDLQAEVDALKQKLQRMGNEKRKPSVVETTEVNVAPGTDFQDFLKGPYKQLVVEKEDFQARALRAEAELADFEQMLEMKIEQFEEEKAALEDEIAELRSK